MFRRPAVPVIAACIGVCAALLLFSSSARARADDFLLLFRAQQKTSTLAIIVAPFPSPPGAVSLPDTPTLAGLARLQIAGGHSVAAVDDAQALVSFSVSRIRRFPRPSDVSVYQDATAQVVANPSAIQGLLSSFAGPQATAPAQLTGAGIEADVREGVRQRWDSLGLSVTYWQLQPPRLRTSSGPPIEQLRNQAIPAYFAIEPQAGQQLLSVQDWDHTVVVPVPPGSRQRQVRVDRQAATLVESQGTTPDSFLIWQKKGILNYLHAPVTGDQLMSYAQSINGD